MEYIEEIKPEHIGQQVTFGYEGQSGVRGLIIENPREENTYLLLNNTTGIDTHEIPLAGDSLREWTSAAVLYSGSKKDLEYRRIKQLKLVGSTGKVKLISKTKFIKINQND